jgi:hypothetical protein
MSGALVIDGIAAYAPQVSKMIERILIARDAPLPGTALPNANVAQVYAMDWAMQHGISMHASRSTASMGSMHGMESMSGLPSTGTRSELHGASTRQTRNPYALIDPKYRRFVRPLATSTHCVAGTNEAADKLLTFHGAGGRRCASRPASSSSAVDPHRARRAAILARRERRCRHLSRPAGRQHDDADHRARRRSADERGGDAGFNDAVALGFAAGQPGGVRTNGSAGGHERKLRTNCFDSGPAGTAMPATLLASINSAAATPAAALKARARSPVAARVSPMARRLRFRSATAVRAVTIAATRTIYYSDQNTINGAAYDPAAPPMFYAQSGTVEEWTIQNNSSQVHTVPYPSGPLLGRGHQRHDAVGAIRDGQRQRSGGHC